MASTMNRNRYVQTSPESAPLRRLRAWTAALLLALPLAAGAFPGVEKGESGEKAEAITSDADLPQGTIAYAISPADTLLIEVFPRKIQSTQRKADLTNEIRLELYFNDQTYRVTPGDVLGIELAGESDKVYDVPVLPNGVINLPRIGRTIPAVGKTTAELAKALDREYASLLLKPRTTVSIRRSGLEQLQRLSGIYIVDNDGNIAVPILGIFKVYGLGTTQISALVADRARDYFHNKIDASASILPLSSRQLADSRLAPDGQQYFRNTVKVNPDGSIFIPDAGTFSTLGKTPDALARELETAMLRVYQNEVQVHVTLQESISQSVYVGGEVRNPGRYPHHASLTIMQVLTAAGWVPDTADLSEVALLHATGGNNYNLYRTNLSEVVAGQSRMRQDLRLSPGDIVIVPKSGVAKANVWIDQWIRRMLPFGMTVNYTFIENRNQ